MQDVVELLGLLPFPEMLGSTTPLHLQEVICVGLGVTVTQLPMFFYPMQTTLPTITTEKLGIDLQHFFKLVDSRDYLEIVKDLYIDRNVFSNLSLMKTAVYLHSVHKLKCGLSRVNTMRSAMISIKMDSREFLCDGVVADRKHMHQVLRQTGRFMPDKMLKHWIERYKSPERQELSPAEFLCLLVNTSDREDTIKKLPYGECILSQESQLGLFPLDASVTHSANPEKWMQLEGNAAFDRSKVIYFKETKVRRNSAVPSPKRKERHRSTVKERMEAGFKALLQNPNLLSEIRSSLVQYSHILPVARAQASLPYSQRKSEDVLFTPVLDMIHQSDISRRHRSVFHQKVQSMQSSMILLKGEGETSTNRSPSRPVSGSARPTFGPPRVRPTSAKSVAAVPVQSQFPARPASKETKRRPRWML